MSAYPDALIERLVEAAIDPNPEQEQEAASHQGMVLLINIGNILHPDETIRDDFTQKVVTNPKRMEVFELGLREDTSKTRIPLRRTNFPTLGGPLAVPFASRFLERGRKPYVTVTKDDAAITLDLFGERIEPPPSVGVAVRPDYGVRRWSSEVKALLEATYPELMTAIYEQRPVATPPPARPRKGEQSASV